MRYYFNLHNDLHTTDEEGREFPDLDAALQSARADARVMAADSVLHGHLNLSHYVEVTDGEGRPVGIVTFGEVVTVSGG